METCRLHWDLPGILQPADVPEQTDGVTDLDWAFTTNAFWGEEASGLWALTVEDCFGLDTGVWNDYSVLAKTGYLIEAVTTVPDPQPLYYSELVWQGLQL